MLKRLCLVILILLVQLLIFDFSLGNNVEIVNKPAMQDDPQRRKPDISRAKKFIGWQPKVIILLVCK